MHLRTSLALVAPLLSLLAGAATGQVEELRPGVWPVRDFGSLALPVSGYQVYLLGELHGLQETEDVFATYMARLHASAGLRHVAIEEDAVYEPDARDYVEGRSSTVPAWPELPRATIDARKTRNQYSDIP